MGESTGEVRERGLIEKSKKLRFGRKTWEFGNVYGLRSRSQKGREIK